jgi:hypothetical protein
MGGEVTHLGLFTGRMTRRAVELVGTTQLLRVPE